jgi:N-acylneuraminate cytidylyltransferase
MPESGARSGSAIVVIPARGGSKRIPRKNIRPFLGEPLLARTIALLANTAIFERIVVSTDDEEIVSVALAAGAETPFRRPARLADDMTGTQPVIAHAIRELEADGARPQYVCCAYPAAVLALPDDLQAAWQRIRAEDLDYVFAATSFPYPIQRALRKTAQGRCEMLWPDQRQARSQDLEPTFHDAGQFYFGLRDAWIAGRPLFGPRSAMLELPRFRVQDIDTAEDWERAELIFRLLHEERGS